VLNQGPAGVRSPVDELPGEGREPDSGIVQG
jgi:hypothetical protein